MLAMESLNYFIELLGVDPKWVIILILVLIISCVCPWKLTGKVETEDEDGKKHVSKIFHLW